VTDTATTRNKAPSHQYLRDVFEYENGSLYWKKDDHQRKQWNAQHAGKRAGYREKLTGYESVCIAPNDRNGLDKARPFQLHRLIFCWHHGYYPEQVDHIDGNRADSRIENLRAAIPYQNAANHGPYSTNKTGCIGVRKRGNGKYEARVSFARKRHHVGSFATIEDARQALAIAKKAIRGEWQRDGVA